MIWFLSCTTAPSNSTESQALQWPEENISSLSTELFYRRASVDLRGVLPTPEELSLWRQLSAEEVVKELLDDERHEDQLRGIFSEWLLTQVEEFNLDHSDYGLPEEESYHFVRSVGEEPLRLMAYVGSRDLPWTEIVTSDYTLSNRLLMEIWPLTPLEPPSETSPD